MKEEYKDEIIEELWKIKDLLSSSCTDDIRKLVEKMNKMAADAISTDTGIEQTNNKQVA